MSASAPALGSTSARADVDLCVGWPNHGANVQQGSDDADVAAFDCDVKSGVAVRVHRVQVVVAGRGEEAHLSSHTSIQLLVQLMRARRQQLKSTEFTCPSAAATCKWLDAEPY